MSYSGLATVSIAIAVLALAVAVAAGLLVVSGRRKLAGKLLPMFLALLAGGILFSIATAAAASDDLQAKARRTLSLVLSAERTELARSGHYATSVVRLERFDRALAADVKVNEPIIRIVRRRGILTLYVSFGPGTRAQGTLRSGG